MYLWPFVKPFHFYSYPSKHLNSQKCRSKRKICTRSSGSIPTPPPYHPANIFYSLFLREIPRKCYACMLFVSLLVWLYHHIILFMSSCECDDEKKIMVDSCCEAVLIDFPFFHLLHTDGGERITRKKVLDRLTSKNSNATQRQQRSSINVTVSLFPTSLQKILFPISLGLDIGGIHVCFGFL